MACFTPNRAWKHKTAVNSNGKSVVTFTEPGAGSSKNWLEIRLPCGKCYGCMLDKKRQWAIRNTCETITAGEELSWFVTLTYNDENIPMPERINQMTGEYTTNPTLVPEDLTLFNKKLREWYRSRGRGKLRFYASGEYGETSGRPHYHEIIWGLNFKPGELKLIGRNGLGQPYYTAPHIEKEWGKGFVTIGQVTYESCAYVSGYVSKKMFQDNKALYDLNNIEPEFSRMSRRPGIGYQWARGHPEIYKNDEIILPTLHGPMELKPAKYFDKIFEEEHHDEMAAIKEKRLEMVNGVENVQATYSTYTPWEVLQIKMREAEQRAKNVIRRGI